MAAAFRDTRRRYISLAVIALACGSYPTYVLRHSVKLFPVCHGTMVSLTLVRVLLKVSLGQLRFLSSSSHSTLTLRSDGFSTQNPFSIVQFK